MKQPWKRKPRTNFLVPASKIRRALQTRGNYAGGGEAWIKLRRSIYQRDGYRCVRCGRHRDEFHEHERLECHHVRPVSRGGTDDKTNLVSVCSTCHAREPGHSHLKRRNQR